jgi:hypothetical protein
MQEQLQDPGGLPRGIVAGVLIDQCNGRFVSTTRSNNPSISQEVLYAFWELTGDKYVYVNKKGGYWRERMEDDDPASRVARPRPLDS